MVTEQLYKAMEGSVKETLEQMAFVEVIQTDEVITELKDSVKAMLKINIFDRQVIFLIKLDITLLNEIAENIFGVNSNSLTNQVKNDVLAELLNTISGRIMRSIMPENQSFDLGIPIIDDDFDNFKNNIEIYFVTSENMKLSLSALFN